MPFAAENSHSVIQSIETFDANVIGRSIKIEGNRSRYQKANNYMARKRVSEKKVVMSTSAAAAPARRKSVSSKRATRPTAVEISNTPEPEACSRAVASSRAVESFQDAVARLAYSYWEARGCQGGSPEADWLRAEQELAPSRSSSPLTCTFSGRPAAAPESAHPSQEPKSV